MRVFGKICIIAYLAIASSTFAQQSIKIDTATGKVEIPLGGKIDFTTPGLTLIGIPVTPTGTGFPHVTSGVQDAAAKLVFNADVDATAAIIQSKINFNGTIPGAWLGLTGTTAAAGNDSRLSDQRTPTDTSVTTAKVVDKAITYAKIQDISATKKLLGRWSVGAGATQEVGIGNGLDIDGSGNLFSTAGGANENANVVFAGPSSGGATTPTFRYLVATDLVRLDQITPPTASVSLNSQKITNLLDPTAAQDAATKNYVDTGSAASLSISGQTGLLTAAGLTSTNRIKTFRDAADTILELGGSYAPTGTWTNLTLVTPALGTPASGVVTNLTGTASININGTVGATTPAAGTFTTLVASTSTKTPIIFPASDSTTAIKITKADGTTAVGTWDTTNRRLILNAATNQVLLIPPTDASTKNYGISNATSVNAGSSRNNELFNIGYNFAPGGRIDSGDIAFAQQLEVFYQPTSYAQMEFYQQYVNASGTIWRPQMLVIRRDNDNTSTTYQGDVWTWIKRTDSSVIASIDPSGVITGAALVSNGNITSTGLIGAGSGMSNPAKDFHAKGTGDVSIRLQNTGGKTWDVNSYSDGNLYFTDVSDGKDRWVMYNAGHLSTASGTMIQWTTSTTDPSATKDTGITRNAAGVLEINSGTAGTLRDITLRNATASGTLSVTGASTLTGGATIGSGGQAILKVLSATATLDFGSTAAGGSTDLTITVTGAALGDQVDIGVPNGSVPAGGTFFGWVSATNTVTIRYADNSIVTSYDPASGTFRATVTQF